MLGRWILFAFFASLVTGILGNEKKPWNHFLTWLTLPLHFPFCLAVQLYFKWKINRPMKNLWKFYLEWLLPFKK